jgi:hypothetical protein
LATGLRQRFVDGPASLGAASRARRWDVIQRCFPDLTELSVIDLGGTTDSWLRAPIRPRRVVVVNLYEPGESDDPDLVPVIGDACAADEALATAGVAAEFDLVFSNSLIEHVGGHAQRVALAGQVRRLAPYHWVQTPYRYFPVEPHYLFPGMQFLPVRAQAEVAVHWPLQHTKPANRTDARNEVQWTELLGISEMQTYFPDSEIYKERMAGLVKSLVAVRSTVSA